MAYEIKQELKLSQKLLLTPQLRLAIRLLQLTRQELVSVVREELEQNPVLEEKSGMEEVETNCEKEKKDDEEIEWQTYLDGHEERDTRWLNFSENEDESFVEKAPSSGQTLKEQLLWQLNSSPLSEKEKKIGEFIIGNIDEHGYLRMVENADAGEAAIRDLTLIEIANSIGVEREEVIKTLSAIHEFDPPGVGARTVKECLLLQAQRMPERDKVLEEVIEKHLDSVAKKNFKAIAKEMGMSLERILDAVHVMTEVLKPMPGAGFGAEEARVIIPDVYIQKHGGEYVVTLNDDGMPKLKISPYYKKMLKKGGDGAAKNYIQERFKAALWLIKSVYQRQRTLKKTVESIVKHQRDFFESGLKYLAPITLKDVATDIEMHESTVSRVTTNKYAHTPRGIFELKYFFSSGMGVSDGSSVTTEYIKERVGSIISSEDHANPLSDQRIVEILKGMGITIARRTAAKYREELGLFSSSARKNH